MTTAFDDAQAGHSADPTTEPRLVDDHAVAPTDDPATTALKLLEEQKDKYLRLAAEFDNFRRRSSKERLEAERRGQGDVVKGLMEALDDLARFAHVDPTTVDSKFVVDGALIVERKLMKSLAGHGLEVIDPRDHPFDPAKHEAVGTAPTHEREEDHLVAQVYQVGYLFHGQLLRPARVVVKQYSDA